MRRVGRGYLLSLTPVQFELIRRVLIDMGSDSYPSIVVDAATGGISDKLLAARDHSVDFRSKRNVDLELTFEEVGVILRVLGFVSLSLSSEECFHEKYGFYSENVRALGREIYSSLWGLEN